MKKICKAIIIFTFCFIQSSFAQKKVTFSLSDGTVIVDNKPPSKENPLNLNIKKGDQLEFAIKDVGNKHFKFTLTDGAKTLSLDEHTFKEGEVKTDGALNYQGLHLNSAIKVSIEVDNHLIKKNINVKLSDQKKQGDTKSSAAGTTVEQISDNNEKRVRPLVQTQAYQLGYPYYDAFTLANHNSVRATLIDSILATYFDGINAPDSIKKMLDENPFFKSDPLGKALKDSVTAADKLNATKITGAQAAQSVISGGSSSIGGLDVTKFADGLAKFLIKRGKQELSLSFFQRFKKVIDKNPDLQVLFPNTFMLLDAIDEKIYNYSAYMQNLREAFKTDIATLPSNFPGIISRHPLYFRTHPEFEAELLGACYLGQQITLEAHPGDILANIPDSLLVKFDRLSQDTNAHYFKGSIETLQLLSGALRDTITGENAPYWVDIAKIRKLTDNKQALKVFLGLLYRRAVTNYNHVVFSSEQTLTGFLDSVTSNDKKNIILEGYKKYIAAFGTRADQLNKMIKVGKNQKADSAAIERYADYFKAVVGLLEQASDVGNLPIPVNPPKTIYQALGNEDFHEKFKPYFDISYHIADLAIDVSKKNYASAINNAVIVYNAIVVKPVISDAETKKVEKGSGEENRKELAKNSLASQNAKNQLSEFVKYSSFMAAVATAKNSDDVESAIEAAALPVGSYSIKQKSAWNISLNGYVGYAWDYTSLKSSFPFLSSKNLFANGIYAPVGFSGSRGLNKWGSLTIFASIIDVGSLVLYNLGKDSTSTLKQQVRLESIVSPSAQLFYEIPGLPIAFGFGWRRTPKLFFSKDTDFKVVPSRSVFNVSVLIDIPIFTLYNSDRK